MSAPIHQAVVLAAGLGTRMRPLTERIPKPLVPVAGRTMLDRALDALVAAGVGRVAVNVHHLASQVEAHLATRTDLVIRVSDERAGLLDSGGGVVAALALLDPAAPFLVLNADTFWLERPGVSNLAALARAFDPARMDAALLLARPADATGHEAGPDFAAGPDGALARWPRGTPDDGSGRIYAGALAAGPALLDSAAATPHSLNRHFDRALQAGRLAGRDLVDGAWITAGTLGGLAAAEARVVAWENGHGSAGAAT